MSSPTESHKGDPASPDQAGRPSCSPYLLWMSGFPFTLLSPPVIVSTYIAGSLCFIINEKRGWISCFCTGKDHFVYGVYGG